MKYQVLKQHFGTGGQYFEGDEREVTNKQDAQQLIDLGLIAEIKETKAAPKPANKMAKEPENKAE